MATAESSADILPNIISIKSDFVERFPFTLRSTRYTLFETETGVRRMRIHRQGMQPEIVDLTPNLDPGVLRDALEFVPVANAIVNVAGQIIRKLF